VCRTLSLFSPQLDAQEKIGYEKIYQGKTHQIDSRTPSTRKILDQLRPVVIIWKLDSLAWGEDRLHYEGCAHRTIKQSNSG